VLARLAACGKGLASRSGFAALKLLKAKLASLGVVLELGILGAGLTSLETFIFAIMALQMSPTIEEVELVPMDQRTSGRLDTKGG